MSHIQTLHEAVNTIAPILKHSPTATAVIKGPPGVGKSDICFQIAAKIGIPEDRILRIHINDYDSIDFTGVPSITPDGFTVFNPTQMLSMFREGSGPGMLIVEELPQSSNAHQTWFAGIELERETPQFKLDPEVRIICTGNRKEDRAGTRPMLSHLNDRLWHFEISSDLDTWVSWASTQPNIDYTDIMFLNWRPNLLNMFDPNREANPTSRSWTKVFTQIPKGLLKDKYLEAAVAAKVGEGAAAEYCSFLKMFKQLPDITQLIKGTANPKSVSIPAELPARFALAGSLVEHADTVNIDCISAYLDQFQEKEIIMLFWSLLVRKEPQMKNTSAFTQFAPKNADYY